VATPPVTGQYDRDVPRSYLRKKSSSADPYCFNFERLIGLLTPVYKDDTP